MNKDKAIQLLERLQDPEPYEPMLTKDAYDAIQMAIDALSADGDTISRKAAIEICDHAIDLLKGQFGAGALVAIKESIEELPPTQPSTGDCWGCNCPKMERLAQPEPSQVAKDIARIVENGQDMRVIAQTEIIRCKDCKHWIPYDWMFSEVWQSKNMADYPEDEIGCNYCDMTMKANDFCSRGERREDG